MYYKEVESMGNSGYEMEFITENIDGSDNAMIAEDNCAPTDESYQYIDYNYRYNN